MPTNVTLKITIKIPSKAVHFTMLGYGGTFNGGVKCDPQAKIDLDKSGAASLTVSPLYWGWTYEYAEEATSRVNGKPDWFRDLRTGAKETDADQLKRTVANLNVSFHQMAGATHAVRFTAEGANPLRKVAPPISADITIGLRKNGGAVQFALSGKHDGFPDYVIELNGREVYRWDCVAHGEDPSALGGGMERDVPEGWRNL